MKTGIELIAQERQEQIGKHGRTIDNDVRFNIKSQLCQAAKMLLFIGEYDSKMPNFKEFSLSGIPLGWNEDIWLKMCKKSYKERLIIAGALIAAEIDRLSALEE